MNEKRRANFRSASFSCYVGYFLQRGLSLILLSFMGHRPLNIGIFCRGWAPWVFYLISICCMRKRGLRWQKGAMGQIVEYNAQAKRRGGCMPRPL